MLSQQCDPWLGASSEATMARPVVRKAVVDDAALVCDLLRRARAESAAVPLSACSVTPLLERPDIDVVVAELSEADGGTRAVALMVLRRAELLPLLDEPAVHVEQLWVDPDARQRGIAKALLRFVAVAAQRHGAAEVVCSVPAGRDANRFLARLGFAPMVVLRAASVPTVLRRCQSDDESSPGRDRILARRRLQRVHRQTGALV